MMLLEERAVMPEFWGTARQRMEAMQPGDSFEIPAADYNQAASAKEKLSNLHHLTRKWTVNKKRGAPTALVRCEAV